MLGVKIGDYHSYSTWGLWLKKPMKITPPEPQTHEVEILGVNGTVDLMPRLVGGTRYKDREIEIELSAFATSGEWVEKETDLVNKIHGKRLQIISDQDPNYYYYGLVTVVDTKHQGLNLVTIKINVLAQPYKVSLDGTVSKL